MVRSDDSYEFKFKEATYHLQCKKGKDERERYARDDSTTTPMSFALKIDGNLVYEFDMRRTVTYGPDSPDYSESFGNISAFIEGPWTDDIDEVQTAMRGHTQQVYKQQRSKGCRAVAARHKEVRSVGRAFARRMRTKIDLPR